MARHSLPAPTIAELQALSRGSGPSLDSQTIFGRTMRRISLFMTWVLLKTQLTPNQVTALGTVIYVFASFLFVFNKFELSVLAIILMVFSTVLDASDGEMARFYKYRYGYGGSYVEPVTHDIMYGIMFLPIAYGAYLKTGNPLLLMFGASASVSKLLFRIMIERFFHGVLRHLKRGGHTDSTKSVESSSGLGKFIIVIYKNIFTSSGLLLILIVATLVDMLDVFIIFYGIGFFVFLLGLFGRQLIRFSRISRQVYERHDHIVQMKARLKNKKFIVFDLDGTLLDTMGIFAEIASHLMSWKHGATREEARRQYLETSGIPFFKQLEVVFPAHHMNDVVADMFEERKVHATDHLVIDDVGSGTLLCLSEKGYTLCISSGNFQDNVDRFVLDSRIPFTTVLGYKDGFAKGKDHFDHLVEKHNIEFSDILFVGDSLSDMKLAQECGVDFIAKTGTFSRHDFERESVRVMTIQNLDELNDLL